MNARLPIALALFAWLSLPATRSDAQVQPVALSNLTVEDRDPPADLLRRFEDETDGVMTGLSVCYAQRLAAVAGLGGQWRLRLWVSAQQVIRVTPESGTFEDAELLQCVKQELLRFRLPPDAPRAGANVRFRLTFSPPAAGQTLVCVERRCGAVACSASGQACCPGAVCGDGLECRDALCQAPLPPPPPPPPPIHVEVTRARGGMTLAELGAALPATLFERCSVGPTGDTAFSLTVLRTGVVRATRLSGSLRDRSARTCLRDALVALRLEPRTRTTYARVVVDLDPPVAAGR